MNENEVRVPVDEDLNQFILAKVLEIKQMIERSSNTVVKSFDITFKNNGVRVVVQPWITAEDVNLDKFKIN